MARETEITAAEERRAAVARALKRYHARLVRKLEALRGDLAEARRAGEFRRYGETLLASVRKVPARAASVTLPDVADPARTLTIELDPAVGAPANAGRYFKRAAKAERGMKEVPRRLAAVEKEAAALAELIERAAAGKGADDEALDGELEAALARVPASVREAIKAPAPARRAGAPRRAHAGEPGAVAKRAAEELPAKLQPRRLKTTEGWAVLIGRNNEGNDYLTHKLARPEDYWFHVGAGVAGSHVVLRRGKGKNEPSKATIEEVASWAAFYSQARTAGKVPVIVTRKKYVRKPRKAPPGLAVCEREKTLMVRPKEPGSGMG